MGKYPHFHIKQPIQIKVENETLEKCKLCVEGEYVGGQYGEMIWVMHNSTNKTQYAGLIRGATVQGEQIPEYLFGRAFGDVYYLLGMSEFIYTTENIPLYSLAVYNGNTIGFVFAIPPMSVLKVPEYGFIDMTSYKARLVTVNFEGLKTWAIAYSPSEYLQYYAELGQNLGILPPAYIVQSLEAKAVDIGYSFHERVIMEIPKQWIDEGIKLGNEIENIISKIKKLL